MRTGLWILQYHAIPHSGLFSQYSTLPWVASSWGFEVLLAVAYKLLGLRAVPVTLMVMKVAFAVSAFLLARGWGRNFWFAVTIAIAAQCALLDLRPSPSFCSLVFFAIELALLLESRRTGNTRLLFWLPLLFALWANVHVQFALGLIVLLMFLTAGLAGEVCRRSGVDWYADVPALPLGVDWGGGGRVLLRHPCVAIYLSGVQGRDQNTSAFAYIAEHHAMNFRHPQHYVLLLLAMAAFLSLGKSAIADLSDHADDRQRNCWLPYAG